jgi:hypothetical protein
MCFAQYGPFGTYICRQILKLIAIQGQLQHMSTNSLINFEIFTLKINNTHMSSICFELIVLKHQALQIIQCVSMKFGTKKIHSPLMNFFFGEISHPNYQKKRKGKACDKYKGFFWEKDAPLSPYYEELVFEIVIF